MKRALRVTAVALAVVATFFAVPPSANAAAPPVSILSVTNCVAWGVFGTCTTGAIPASAAHQIQYDFAPCGYGNIYDTVTGQRVGGSNLVLSGTIGGLYGSYYLVFTNVTGTFACAGSIQS